MALYESPDAPSGLTFGTVEACAAWLRETYQAHELLAVEDGSYMVFPTEQAVWLYRETFTAGVRSSREAVRRHGSWVSVTSECNKRLSDWPS